MGIKSTVLALTAAATLALTACGGSGEPSSDDWRDRCTNSTRIAAEGAVETRVCEKQDGPSTFIVIYPSETIRQAAEDLLAKGGYTGSVVATGPTWIEMKEGEGIFAEQ